MRSRGLLIAALAATMVLGVAAPAGAATGSITDPVGDVQNDSGAPATDARLDITGVSFTNEADRMEVRVAAAQMTPFTDPAWQNELELGVVLEDTGASSNTAPYQWIVSGENGEVVSYLSDDGGYPCRTEVTQTATEYVLTADDRCTHALPRSLRYGAYLVSLGETEVVYDTAPNGQDLAAAVAAAEHGAVRRAAGTDRVLTAIALSKGVVDDGAAGAVVLASARSFPDALAGGPLAVAKTGPLLLTDVSGLDARTKAEIVRVLPAGGDVFVLGGTAALSDKVVADVRAAGFTASRIAGSNRFETAIAIANQVEVATGYHDTVLIADGRVPTDALIAAAAAPFAGGVVVLTDGTTMPPSTAQYLGSDQSQHIAIGANAAKAAAGVYNITGSTPAELSVHVAAELGPAGTGMIGVASQSSFADALAGGPYVAAFGAPLLLTDPATLSKPTADVITAAAGSLRDVVLFGGTAAVSTNVANQISAILNKA